MRYNSQRTMVAQTARIDLADESIDGSGAGAASPGASFRLINSSAHDATFIPDSPQTVAGGTSLVIPARSSRTFELSPQGDWLVIQRQRSSCVTILA